MHTGSVVETAQLDANRKGRTTLNENLTTYEPPTVERVGSLADLTLKKKPKKHKFVATTSDFIYPTGFSFNFS
jgi:hypothetical protein